MRLTPRPPFALTLCLAVVLCGVLSAESPKPVGEIAPLADLNTEIGEQIESLTKDLSEESSFEEIRKGTIRQSFGLLACLGQALAEHPEGDSAEANGPALRQAALLFTTKSSYADAQAAFEKVKMAADGTSEAVAEKMHPWNKLVNMHPMMEEMNARNSAILKVLRRPRGKPEETAHATTWAVLGLAMHADTHEVKNDADIPEWHRLSDEFISSSVKLAEAIKAKDKDEGRKWFDAANAACDECHEKFRDN